MTRVTSSSHSLPGVVAESRPNRRETPRAAGALVAEPGETPVLVVMCEPGPSGAPTIRCLLALFIPEPGYPRVGFRQVASAQAGRPASPFPRDAWATPVQAGTAVMA